MNRNDTINFICTMPALFHERSNVSVVELLSEVGGPDAISDVCVADFAEALRDRPEHVQAWFQQSEDNRSSPAWFVCANPDGSTWEVGFYPDGESTHFDTPADACANYIRHYLDQLCE